VSQRTADPLLRFALLILPLLFAMGLPAQQTGRPSDAELDAITARGRALAAYDQAAWHATDALQTANPRTAQGQHCLAHFANERWTVVFGYLNSDQTKFLVSYEAVQGSKPHIFSVSRVDPPKEDTGFYLFAARALEIALADFGRPGRPYSSAVLPASDGQLYVYLYPALEKAGIYPLGGDVRYLVSDDGRRILEKRQMHKTIIETSPARGRKTVARVHPHVLGDSPEDSDILHVLQQDPPTPEMIAAPHVTYEVTADGSIRIKQERKK